MQGILQLTDYRVAIQTLIRAMPKGGYGQARRLAEHLSIHTTLVSQVLVGKKSFTLEQAAGAAEFFSLNELETDYFLLLVQRDRAGSESLRRNLDRQLEKLRAHSSELVNRLNATRKLKEEERAIFYSDWIYSAIRQQTAIEGFHSVESLAEHFGLSRKRTREAVDFLLSVQLCVEKEGGIRIGPASTHVESSSAWVRMHHVNWRQKAIESLKHESSAKLHYTAPMTLSEEDAIQLREMIVKFLESVDKVVEPSPSEVQYCLNMDWFAVK